ncbi:MAG: glycoside hydrolase/phage tail family protein [Pseudomonadota bacterium]
MATLVLQYAGQALGSAVGGPAGALLGRAAGAIAGQFIDQALLGDKPRRATGPRLDDLKVQGSSEGSAVPQVFGRVRVAGQLIWATNFEEMVSTRTEKAGGKGAPSTGKSELTEYTYFANFAVGLCEGEISRIGRVWADGKEIDVSGYTTRVYRGDEHQAPDSLIEAKEGAGFAPAYRGLAYIVFESLPLEQFGNRLPQLSFEVFRGLDDVETRVRSVAVIPGLTEFGYHPEPVTRDAGFGETAPENTNALAGRTDWSLAMDQLQATFPNLASVSLVVSWFADDLRCGQCLIQPGVENPEKVTSPVDWGVTGLDRAGAYAVSEVGGRPAFGGTPSDNSVVAAIQDLKARGLKVTFYPFLNLDVPASNGRQDPYSGAADQPVYPWRGRITCDPAPAVAETPDQSPAVLPQIESFFGTAVAGDYSVSGETVIYTGPVEWSYRRMVLHYAHLCEAAGGVDAFLIGSELRGLTTLRDTADHYPVVDELVALASDVAQVLPQAAVSYAADWSEYFGHHPQDGSGDVFFHLDPLWSSPDIAFVGIDNYMPLSDWRDGAGHADALAGHGSVYDLSYLQSNIAGGEGFDWYYASQANRDAQVRSAITDGAAAKPWVFRYKDLAGWWGETHFDRPGGAENPTPTGWVPRSKPIRFTEAGCPAVDKGSNQPNVFYDAKSSESALPHYSSGDRDDLIQRAYLDAVSSFWATSGTATNPVSEIYAGPMLDPEHISFWAWDARPFPAFPYLDEVWSDGANYERGHWLNGRAGGVTLKALVEAVLSRHGFIDGDALTLSGLLDGYLIDRPMSVRDALEPLSLAYFFDGVETAGTIVFRHREQPVSYDVDVDELADPGRNGPLYERTRAQETELPAEVSLSYVDNLADYRRAAVSTRRLSGHSVRKATADLPAVLSQSAAQERADIWLQDTWAGREKLELHLPPRLIALDAGDVISLDGSVFAITSVLDSAARAVSARKMEPTVYRGGAGPQRGQTFSRAQAFGPAEFQFLDLPLLSGGEEAHDGWIAASAKPWPGQLSLLRVTGPSASFVRNIDAPATMGETLWDFYAGPTARLDRGNRLRIRMRSGALQSVSDLELLNGANVAALRNGEGVWEVFQFRDAVLTSADVYEVSALLRGQGGSELAMRNPVPAGAPFVLLNGAVLQANLSLSDVGRALTWRWGPRTRDASDPSYAEEMHTFTGVGQRPLSPVHVRGAKEPGGIGISWVRRTRLGGDSWAQVEVPLAEEVEAYEVDILNDTGATVRTLSSAVPSVQYADAEITADFGAVPSSLKVRVYQLSATAGRGSYREKVLHV